jgi:trans-2,3-dihydro-3-hydroxyanthranilate isomerase
LINSPTFIAQQGHWLGRPGQALLDVVGPPDGIETVKLSGTAVTTIVGELMIG